MLDRLRNWFRRSQKDEPGHLRTGRIGEDAARRHLAASGWKTLTTNFRGRRGEIDIVARKADCIAFVEVKTRASGGWTRPAAAVNARKRRLLAITALEYLHRAGRPRVNVRFDIVEVLCDSDVVVEVRHLENAFTMPKPYRYD